MPHSGCKSREHEVWKIADRVGDISIARRIYDEHVAPLVSAVDRLRKIESAARVYFLEFDHLIGDEYPERADLRHALGLAHGRSCEHGRPVGSDCYACESGDESIEGVEPIPTKIPEPQTGTSARGGQSDA